MTTTPLAAEVLPRGVRARLLADVNGLTMHVLEAGAPEHPCVLLLHGFPELAWSWRYVMPALAEAGYHVVAPDQRGYGRTTGWDPDYDGDLRSFRMTNLVRDALALLAALGRPSVRAVVGHDFGASVAAWCALLRPDVFRSVVLMSAPFAGPPRAGATVTDDIHRALAALPRPRKHYQWYYSTREANDTMQYCTQGVHTFLRAYFHMKSADWPGNNPVRLPGWTADALASMPTYYIMDLDRDMAATVAAEAPPVAAAAACRWLPEEALRIYSETYARTGFQGGLQWYRCRTEGIGADELQLSDGKGIEVPSMFVAGRQDWGIRQAPGALERMQQVVCRDMRGCHLLAGAGHWVQQEQPEAVLGLLTAFLGSAVNVCVSTWA